MARTVSSSLGSIAVTGQAENAQLVDKYDPQIQAEREAKAAAEAAEAAAAEAAAAEEAVGLP